MGSAQEAGVAVCAGVLLRSDAPLMKYVGLSWPLFLQAFGSLLKKKAPPFEREGKQCDFHQPPPSSQAESEGPLPAFISSGHFHVWTDC